MIRGYCVMLEYWQDEAKTRECITKDRWYKTGYVWASSGTVDFQHWRTYKTLHFHGIQLIPMFHSDIASLDKFGYCKIEGRIKDMIIRGGENIYPAEIEQFLHTHPKVQEAQVDQAYPGSLDFLSFISMHNLIRMSEKLCTWSCTYAIVFCSRGVDRSLAWAP